MQCHYWGFTSNKKNLDELCWQSQTPKPIFSTPYIFWIMLSQTFTVDAEDPFINSPSLFNEHQPFVLMNNLFCEKYESKYKVFVK